MAPSPARKQRGAFRLSADGIAQLRRGLVKSCSSDSLWKFAGVGHKENKHKDSQRNSEDSWSGEKPLPVSKMEVLERQSSTNKRVKRIVTASGSPLVLDKKSSASACHSMRRSSLQRITMGACSAATKKGPEPKHAATDNKNDGNGDKKGGRSGEGKPVVPRAPSPWPLRADSLKAAPADLKHQHTTAHTAHVECIPTSSPKTAGLVEGNRDLGDENSTQNGDVASATDLHSCAPDSNSCECTVSGTGKMVGTGNAPGVPDGVISLFPEIVYPPTSLFPPSRIATSAASAASSMLKDNHAHATPDQPAKTKTKGVSKVRRFFQRERQHKEKDKGKEKNFPQIARKGLPSPPQTSTLHHVSSSVPDTDYVETATTSSCRAMPLVVADGPVPGPISTKTFNSISSVGTGSSTTPSPLNRVENTADEGQGHTQGKGNNLAQLPPLCRPCTNVFWNRSGSQLGRHEASFVSVTGPSKAPIASTDAIRGLTNRDTPTASTKQTSNVADIPTPISTGRSSHSAIVTNEGSDSNRNPHPVIAPATAGATHSLEVARIVEQSDLAGVNEFTHEILELARIEPEHEKKKELVRVWPFLSPLFAHPFLS